MAEYLGVDLENLKPSVTAEDFVEEAMWFKKMLDWGGIGNAPSNSFVFLISVKWLETWEEKVGFSLMDGDKEYGPQDVKLEKELPQMNRDLIDDSFQEKTLEYEYVTSNTPLFSLFGPVTKGDIMEGFDYIIVKEDFWRAIQKKYPDAIEVMKIKYTDPITEFSKVEVKFPMVKAYFLPQSELKYSSDPNTFKPKQYRFQISLRMEVDELKGLLCDIINKVVDPLKLPMNFTADNINVFLLKDGNGIDELQKALAKEYLSMFSTVESVKIPGECLKNKNFKLCRYDFALSGSTIVVEIKSSYKFKMVGEDDNQEEDIVESIFNHSRNKNTGMSMESTGSSSSSYKTYNFPEHSTLSLNGTVGLRNIGNTCYMNAALQCLSHTTELSNYFLDRKYKKDINLKNPLGSQGKVAENYAGLIFELWNGVKSIASPSFLRGEIARQNNNFDNFNQHDSQELLSFILDALHEDLNLIEKKPYTDKVESHDANVDRLVLSRQSWVNHLKRNFSFIYKLFFAQFQSEVICKECKTISLTYEPYQIISLGIPGTTTFYADFFYIPPNHSVKASKFSIEVVCQSGYSGEVANTMGDLYKELPEDLLKVPKDRVQMFFVGFSVRGDSISPNTKISKVMEKVNEHSYRPNLFLFALTEEEANIRDSPNSFIVMGLVCREEKNPSFNKVMFMYENSTLVQLYFECFKKFAHFYKSEYGEQGIEDTVKSNVDYQRSFLLNFMDIPVEERDFVISYNDKPYPLTVENQLTPLSEIFDSNSFIGDPRHVWINIVFRPNSNERIYFDSTKQCIIEKEAITVRFSSDLPEKIDIQYLLKKFSEPEDIDDDNLFHCSTCKKHTQITKTMHIYNVPRYLILHMKKLKLGLSRRSKPILDIKFPLEGMDITDCVTSHSTIDSLKINREEFGTDNMDKLQQFVDPFENRSEPDRLIYDCYAVINHTGSNYSGHYTAYAKTGDKWNYYDDDRIYPVYNPEYEVVTERAYVLFYKLREKEDQHPQQESTINKQ